MIKCLVMFRYVCRIRIQSLIDEPVAGKQITAIFSV